MTPAFRVFFSLVLVALAPPAGSLRAAEAAPAPDARELGRGALTELEAGNLKDYLAKMKAAVALRPDYPRLLVNLAAAQVANGRVDDAIDTLNRLADLGVSSPVEKSKDFESVRDNADFKAVVVRLAANLQSIGKGEIEFSLRDMTGIVEGIAWREKTGEFLFGDVRNRAIWARGKDGSTRRFSQNDSELYGVFGMVVDESRGVLWAATSVRPEMKGFAKSLADSAGVAEIDLASGRVLGIRKIPHDIQEHVLGSLALAPDGSLYVTDSASPTLWRFPPRGAEPEAFIENPEFASLQGIAVTPDGKALVVADYAAGLLRIDLRTRAVAHIRIPANSTLIGIASLTVAPDDTLVAVQNGTRPMRILRLTLNQTSDEVTGVNVLESGHINIVDPAGGTIADGYFHFIGNAGWTRFEPPATAADVPRVVPVFRTRL